MDCFESYDGTYFFKPGLLISENEMLQRVRPIYCAILRRERYYRLSLEYGLLTRTNRNENWGSLNRYRQLRLADLFKRIKYLTKFNLNPYMS